MFIQLLISWASRDPRAENRKLQDAKVLVPVFIVWSLSSTLFRPHGL